jgi:hypothetical protein
MVLVVRNRLLLERQTHKGVYGGTSAGIGAGSAAVAQSGVMIWTGCHMALLGEGCVIERTDPS